MSTSAAPHIPALQGRRMTVRPLKLIDRSDSERRDALVFLGQPTAERYRT